MGRLVRFSESTRSNASGDEDELGRDRPRLTSAPRKANKSKAADYADRLIKMIPGEAVAVFLAVDAIAKSTLPTEPGAAIEPRAIALAWGVFVVVALLNVGYLRLTQVEGDTRGDFLKTAAISTLAFVVWVYSIQATVVTVTGWYWAPLASVLIILVTALAPFLGGKLGTGK